jgi:CheY-like chemotaxis protein
MQAAKHLDVLLVEDNPNDRDLAIHAMRRAGYAPTLEHIDDGARALDYLFGAGEFADRDLSVAPRLVLLDLKLPKMSGLEVLKTLRGDARTRMLPVVMLTSSREAHDILESYRNGVNGFVVKPIDFMVYTQVVAEICHFWLEINVGPDAV